MKIYVIANLDTDFGTDIHSAYKEKTTAEKILKEIKIPNTPDINYEIYEVELI